MNYQKDSQNVKVLIGVYTIPELTKNIAHISSDFGLGDLSFTCYSPITYQSRITIEGKINYKNKETSTINDIILYYNKTFTDSCDIFLDDGTTAVFSVTLDSPTVIADLVRELSFIPVDKELFAATYRIEPTESNDFSFHFPENENYQIIRSIYDIYDFLCRIRVCTYIPL